MSHQLYRGDLPDGIDFGSAVAIDTEAMGLNPHRDRLCLVQLSAGDGTAHVANRRLRKTTDSHAFLSLSTGLASSFRLRTILAGRLY